MAVTPVLLTKTVTTAGTQVQVTTDADIKPSSVYFEALNTNTGDIYIGLSDVSSTVYIACITAGQGFSIGSHAGANFRTGSQGIQLSDLWVDSEVNGEKVQVTYMYAVGG